MADLAKLARMCPEGVSSLVAGVCKADPKEGARLLLELGGPALRGMFSNTDTSGRSGILAGLQTMLSDSDFKSFGLSMEAISEALGARKPSEAMDAMEPGEAGRRQWQACLLRVSGKRATEGEKEMAREWMISLFPNWRPEGGQIAQMINDSSPSLWSDVLNAAVDRDEDYLERLETGAELASSLRGFEEMVAALDRFAPCQLVQRMLELADNKERREKAERLNDEIVKRALIQSKGRGGLAERRRMEAVSVKSASKAKPDAQESRAGSRAKPAGRPVRLKS